LLDLVVPTVHLFVAFVERSVPVVYIHVHVYVLFVDLPLNVVGCSRFTFGYVALFGCCFAVAFCLRCWDCVGSPLVRLFCYPRLPSLFRLFLFVYVVHVVPVRCPSFVTLLRLRCCVGYVCGPYTFVCLFVTFVTLPLFVVVVDCYVAVVVGYSFHIRCVHIVVSFHVVVPLLFVDVVVGFALFVCG
jgi:hypothetical protein